MGKCARVFAFRQGQKANTDGGIWVISSARARNKLHRRQNRLSRQNPSPIAAALRPSGHSQVGSEVVESAPAVVDTDDRRSDPVWDCACSARSRALDGDFKPPNPA